MMKKGKPAGPTGIVSEMFMADEDCGVEWLTSLCNLTVDQGRNPDDWRSSILLPVFKGKGNLMECGSYRVKLLEHAMKVIEHVFERKIREKVKIDAMQLLYFAFVDLEKAFDRVPREVTRWALRKAGVDERLVKVVMAMYEGAQTVVRTIEGDSKAFNVKIGLHQGSVLSPLLFVIVMEMISRELRAVLPQMN